MSTTILIGDVTEQLRTLPDESVQCVVTSPPYWGLRDYGTGTWEGGDAECDHSKAPAEPRELASNDGGDKFRNGTGYHDHVSEPHRDTCGKCGARRIDSQIGLEPTPAAYLDRMVAVFREVRRVLRKDGTLWMNMGDGYNGVGGPGKQDGGPIGPTAAVAVEGTRGTHAPGLKPKDLIGMPWRLALALQADGWWLRSDIIWAKPNPMPEPCTDRPTKSHEYVFLLTKSARYFWDAEAVKEAATYGRCGWDSQQFKGGDMTKHHGGPGSHMNGNDPSAGRNLRTVWTIATESFKGAHFATFPRKLVAPCLKAGTSAKGRCPECGAPWVRVVEKHRTPTGVQTRAAVGCKDRNDAHYPRMECETTTTGWRPQCEHGLDPVPCVCLDPFCGSGTTGVVAKQLGLDFIGTELNPEYAAMAERRIANPEPEAETPDSVGQMPLFS